MLFGRRPCDEGLLNVQMNKVVPMGSNRRLLVVCVRRVYGATPP